MSEDFEFDFNGGETPQPSIESEPQQAPVDDLAPPKKGKGKKIALRALALVGAFLLGVLTCYFSFDSEFRALSRLKKAVQSNYYEKVSDKEFYDVLFKAVNENLLDPYSAYMNPDEFADYQTEATGEWSGIGITFLVKDEKGNDCLQVADISGNSPAEHAGIKVGEYVLGFGKTAEEIKQNVKFKDFSEFLDGFKAGEPFFVCVSDGTNSRTVSLSRKAFIENYVFYRAKTSAYRFTGSTATTMEDYDGVLSVLDEKTAYIRLKQFNGGAVEQFRQAMNKFKAENKIDLILDLRENGGGYMDILQEISSYFCKSSQAKNPLIAIARERDGDEDRFHASGNVYKKYFSETSRIRVLADNQTASASECLLGVLLDYGACSYSDICLSKRGGEAKTYGKGIMQTTYPLSLINPDAVKLTTAKILWPKSENCIHARGLLPEDGCKTVEEHYVGDTEIINAWQLFQS